MQTQLLAQIPTDQLSVYAVWLPMLAGDAREKWNGSAIPDARVKHFWDGEYLMGRWFAKEVDGYEGISWDVYYLYGPEAVWETVPSPLVGSGETIYRDRGTLKTQLLSILNK